MRWACWGGCKNPSFPLALAALLAQQADAAAVREVGLRWKLSNKETDEAAWLVEHRDALAGARSMRWSKLQPVLAHPWAESLVALHEASSPQGPDEAAYCRELLAQPREKLDPPPLLTGDDLRRLGLQPGPSSRRSCKPFAMRSLTERYGRKRKRCNWRWIVIA